MQDLTHASTSAGRRSIITALITGSALALSSCSDSTGVGAGRSQLAFAVTNPNAPTAALAALVPVTKGGHTLDLTAVTVTVSRAELKLATTDLCADDEGSDGRDHGNCAEVHTGPASIDLPLDGSLVTIPANTLPAGTFREFELRLSFIRFKGTFDGQPFDVTVASDARAEIQFDTPLAVTADVATSITVNLPVFGWLTNSDGSLVDPRTILTSSSVMSAVRQRIAASVHAFEDRDHDGVDDHGRHG
jgi:hypothetical protein